MKPHCHNRPPRPPGWWHPVRQKLGDRKPRYRWVSHEWSEDRCAAWDVPDGAKPAPLIMGWNCEGCRWLPVNAQAATQTYLVLAVERASHALAAT